MSACGTADAERTAIHAPAAGSASQEPLPVTRALSACTADEQIRIDEAIRESLPQAGDALLQPPKGDDELYPNGRMGIWTCDAQLVYVDRTAYNDSRRPNAEALLLGYKTIDAGEPTVQIKAG
jgi:hypothetical protein